MTENTPPPKWLSRQEAAFLLSLTLDEVDRLIHTGLLDRYRIRGRYVRVLRSQVDELAQVDPSILRRA
jgi:excisionase family DNA binding protein